MLGVLSAAPHGSILPGKSSFRLNRSGKIPGTRFCLIGDNRETTSVEQRQPTAVMCSTLLTTAVSAILVGSCYGTELQDAPVTSQKPSIAQAETGRSSSVGAAFDMSLLSIISTADNLSAATDEFLELTSALSGPAYYLDDSTPAGSATAPASSSPEAPARSTRLISSRHTMYDGDAWFMSPSMQCSTPSPVLDGPAVMGAVASRMSQRALAVAAEAVNLATILEKEGQMDDPSYAMLLKQIEEAARTVSAVAADIAAPLLQEEYNGMQ